MYQIVAHFKGDVVLPRKEIRACNYSAYVQRRVMLLCSDSSEGIWTKVEIMKWEFYIPKWSLKTLKSEDHSLQAVRFKPSTKKSPLQPLPNLDIRYVYPYPEQRKSHSVKGFEEGWFWNSPKRKARINYCDNASIAIQIPEASYHYCQVF